MALNTVTLLSLVQKLGEANADYLTFNTTTNITTDNYVISTTLGEYDESEDNHFGGGDDRWWVYVSGTANVGVSRRASAYSAASTRITVEGAAFAAESAAITCYISRYPWARYTESIIASCTELYDALYVPVDSRILVTGNILPDGSFESWASSTTLNWWTAGSATLTKTSDHTYIKGQRGSFSAKVTAGGAADYIELTSITYPRLLDLSGKEVSAYVWAYPEVTDDPTIELYTLDTASSAQTLTSTTSATAAMFTKLELEDQQFNENLNYVRIRLKIATNAKYCYFDDMYLSGMRLSEYLLPDEFIEGNLAEIRIQSTGYSDEAFYDQDPFQTNYVNQDIPFDIISDGTYPYIKLLRDVPTERRLRLIGKKPLETMAANTTTITIDAWRVPLVTARARMIFWERQSVPISSKDKSIFEYEYSKAERDYRRTLNRMRMPMFTVGRDTR